jgi:predicted nuclease with RNAse H fold
MKENSCIAGIDFGSQLAGTTCFALKSVGSNNVTILTSTKGKSADKFIWECVEQYSPSLIGIDAPLSLPLFFTNPNEYPDNNFRMCDKALSAMSPMFLGGLTSRAMKLKFQLEQRAIECIEVYPKAFAHQLELEKWDYKKDKKNIMKCLELLMKSFECSLQQELTTWHEFDSMLALAICERYATNEANSVGNEEGYIYF